MTDLIIYWKDISHWPLHRNWVTLSEITREALGLGAQRKRNAQFATTCITFGLGDIPKRSHRDLVLKPRSLSSVLLSCFNHKTVVIFSSFNHLQYLLPASQPRWSTLSRTTSRNIFSGTCSKTLGSCTEQHAVKSCFLLPSLRLFPEHNPACGLKEAAPLR